MMVSYNIFKGKEKENERQKKQQDEKNLKIKLVDTTKDIAQGLTKLAKPEVQAVLEPLLNLGSDKAKEIIESS